MDASIQIAAAIASHGDVRCVVRNFAASGAFGVLQACKERVMARGARLMTHQPRVFVSVPLDLPLANYVAGEVAKNTDTWNRLCAARLRVTPAEYAARVAGKDWAMTADEALSVGAVDSVL